MSMEILIQDHDGKKKIVLEVEPEDTFENVKAKMQDKEEIPADLCDLYHKDTLLQNETTVSGFGLQRGSNLLFVLSFEKMKAKMDKEKAEKAKKEDEERDKAEKAKKDETGPSHSGCPAMVSCITFNNSTLI